MALQPLAQEFTAAAGFGGKTTAARAVGTIWFDCNPVRLETGGAHSERAGRSTSRVPATFTHVGRSIGRWLLWERRLARSERRVTSSFRPRGRRVLGLVAQSSG